MEELSNVVSLSTLHPIHEWGINLIKTLQSFQSPVLTTIAKGFTFLGDPTFYIILLPILFWVVSEKRGFKIGLIVFISNGINIAIKNAYKIPRPYTRDSSVFMIPESGFSTPSGHSQNSAVLWPAIALTGKINKLWISISILLPIFIGLSRMYLGVHYPTDVFLGWSIGVFIILCGFPLLRVFLAWWQKALNGPFESIYTSFKKHKETNPKAERTWWLILIALTSLLLLILSPEDTSMPGIVFGFAAGYVFLKTGKGKDFSANEGSLVKKLLRLVVGFIGISLIYFGLKAVFPGSTSPHGQLFRFLRYGLTGFWASFVAPILFLRFRI